jgi:hypothetical protein
MLIVKGDDFSIEAQRANCPFVSEAEQMSGIPLPLSPFLSHHVGLSRRVSGGGSTSLHIGHGSSAWRALGNRRSGKIANR